MFKLDTVIDESSIFLGLKSKSKKALIKEMLAKACELDGMAEDEDELLSALLAREKLESTGIGFGVAIPHCHYKSFKFNLKVYVGFPVQPLDFKSIDDSVVRVVFMIISNAMSNDNYLKCISRIMYFLKNVSMRESIFTISSGGEFVELVRKNDKHLEYISYDGLKQLMSLLEFEDGVSTYYQETILTEGKRQGSLHLKDDKYYTLLQDSVNTLKSNMDNRLVMIYKQLSKKYGRDIFAKVVGRVCSGCNVQLPVHVMRELDRHNMLIQCGDCSKILIRN